MATESADDDEDKEEAADERGGRGHNMGNENAGEFADAKITIKSEKGSYGCVHMPTVCHGHSNNDCQWP